MSADAWMTYGLADVVNQRRMIDEGEAEEDFKWLQRSKLAALLALCEAHDCRRVRPLGYFGQDSLPRGNCDNCLQAPDTWDATEAARKALSFIYRFRQAGGQRYGAGHLIDVLRGKANEKVAQHGHERLSTFGIGADVSEAQWRLVLRQLIALGHVRTEGEYGTLALADSARDGAASKPSEACKTAALPLPLDAAATELFLALKAWRSEVARAHNLPAYVVFHDATLAQMARECPATLDALAGISGVGSKKLEAYGSEILRLLADQ